MIFYKNDIVINFYRNLLDNNEQKVNFIIISKCDIISQIKLHLSSNPWNPWKSLNSKRT